MVSFIQCCVTGTRYTYLQFIRDLQSILEVNLQYSEIDNRQIDKQSYLNSIFGDNTMAIFHVWNLVRPNIAGLHYCYFLWRARRKVISVERYCSPTSSSTMLDFGKFSLFQNEVIAFVLYTYNTIFLRFLKKLERDLV